MHRKKRFLSSETITKTDDSDQLSLKHRAVQRAMQIKQSTQQVFTDVYEKTPEMIQVEKWWKKLKISASKWGRKYMDDILYKPPRSIKQKFSQFKISPQKPIIIANLRQFVLIGLVTSFFLSGIVIVSNWQSLKNHLKGLAYESLEDISEAAEALVAQDLDQGLVLLNNADKKVTEVAEYFQYFPAELEILLGQDSQVIQASNLVTAATLITAVGQDITQDLTEFKDGLKTDLLTNNGHILVLIDQLFEKWKKRIAKLKLAEQKLAMVDNLPVEFQNKFINGRAKLGKLVDLIEMLIAQQEPLHRLLGDPHPQRYLIVLQNKHELRGSGGFNGSFIIITVNNGQITDFKFQDIYDIDNQLLHPPAAPEGLAKLAKYWGMRDASYNPDFRQAAQDIRWFLDKGKGVSVNGIIRVDQSVVEKVLSKTGGIKIPGLDIELNKDNFSFLISYLVEAKILDSGSPKEFLMDLQPFIFNKLKQLSLADLKDLLLDTATEKDWEIFLDDYYWQKIAEHFGVSGTVIDTNSDFAQIILTSVSGNKSDAYIHQRWQHQSEIMKNGFIKHYLQIKRFHSWGLKEDNLFEILKTQFGTGKMSTEGLKEILGAGASRSFIRMYLPLEAELLKSPQALIEKKILSDRQVWTFYTQPLNSGESEIIDISYRVPYKSKNYQFNFYKQSGLENVDFHKIVRVGESSVGEVYPLNYEIIDGQVLWESDLKGDMEYYIELN